MSSQEEEPHQVALQEVAARIIQRAWRSHMAREVFRYLKGLIFYCKQLDLKTILKTVNPREAELLDAAAGVFIRFRLGGVRAQEGNNGRWPNSYVAPRTIPSKVLQSLWPRALTKGPHDTKEDRSGWYQRRENNSWRLFCNKVAWMCEPAEIGGDKKMDFHYSKLQRKQDVERWRKRKKTEWLKQMYKEGRLQDHAEHRHIVTLVESSVQEVMDTTERG